MLDVVIPCVVFWFINTVTAINLRWPELVRPVVEWWWVVDVLCLKVQKQVSPDLL